MPILETGCSLAAIELGDQLAEYSIEETTRKKFFDEIRQAIYDYGGIITLYDTIDLQIARKP